MSAASPADVGVVGAGLMGAGIAEAAARSGLAVVLYEPQEAALARGAERIAASLRRSVAAGKLDERQAASARERIAATTSLAELASVPVVVEAIVEDADVKAGVFRALDELLPADAVLASNTSSIPIAQLAAATQRPERVLGLHFFSPVPAMRLVEVVVALDTAPAAVERAEAFVHAIGKRPIRTRDRSGFLVNKLLVPYLISAMRMLEEGFATREDIDEGMQLGAGHPLGPLRLCDLIGLDVMCAVCDSLYDEFRREEYAPPPLLRRMVLAGHLGRKSGRGFYSYAT